MKILYYVTFPDAMGADRWIYEGYKNAFLEEGHQFYTLTERDNFEKVVQKTLPDLLMIEFSCFVSHLRKGNIKSSFLPDVRKLGTKIFMMAGTEYNDDKEYASLIKEYSRFVDIFYSNMSDQLMEGFTFLSQKPCYFVPHAADIKYFFPDTPDHKYACDICFVGNKLNSKKIMFKEVLYPVMRKYNVRIYGTGWTIKDKILRLASGFSRQMKIGWLADWVNRKRLTITQDQERKLYASAKICLNFHEYFEDGKNREQNNEREYKIPASGGFQMSDYLASLVLTFEPDKEIVMAKTPAEWFSKIEYYLTHESVRIAIQKNGTARVLNEHTYRHRVKRFVEMYNNLK
jgi:spore maturation protein CgeB